MFPFVAEILYLPLNWASSMHDQFCLRFYMRRGVLSTVCCSLFTPNMLQFDWQSLLALFQKHTKLAHVKNYAIRKKFCKPNCFSQTGNFDWAVNKIWENLFDEAKASTSSSGCQSDQNLIRRRMISKAFLFFFTSVHYKPILCLFFPFRF